MPIVRIGPSGFVEVPERPNPGQRVLTEENVERSLFPLTLLTKIRDAVHAF